MLGVGTLKSQTTSHIEYTYDNAGNRTSRTVIVISEKKIKQQDTTKIHDSIKNISEQKIDSIILFSENTGNINVSVYPNPTLGLLNIKITNTENPNENVNAEYSIINENGMTVLNNKYSGMLQAIDFTIYTSGIYYLKINNEKINKTIKIVKGH